MPTRYTIVQGDSVARLAERHGLAPETIWNDAANDALRAARADMNILLPGDVIVIPDKHEKRVPAATGRRHVFRRRGVPMRFRVRVLFDGTPLGAQPYVLEVAGVQHRGETDAGGWIDHYIPNAATKGKLVVGDAGALTFDLEFGHMDPIDTLSGVQKRLSNLGFPCAADGQPGPATTAAVRRFQLANGLEETGELDDATRAKLAAVHDTRPAGARP